MGKFLITYKNQSWKNKKCEPNENYRGSSTNQRCTTTKTNPEQMASLLNSTKYW